MRASRLWVWVSLFLCTDLNARPLDHSRLSAMPPQTVSAAAVQIAAPFGIVTSTFRTVEHNRAVGGVWDSYHLLGQAIDVVRRPGVSHAQIAAALRAAGIHLIESLDEGSHSHFAFGMVARKVARVPTDAARSVPRNQLAADRHGTLQIDLHPSRPSDRAKIQSSAIGQSAIH